MKFPIQLSEARIQKRYKRFFADLSIQGKTEVAHVPNTGSLKSVLTENAKCLYSRTDDPNRKLKFTLEAIQTNDTWVGVNTSWPNKIALTLFNEKQLKHWLNFDFAQAEVKISNESRIDLVLWNSENCSLKKISFKDLQSFENFHFVEIKNVTLAQNIEGKMVAQFPDAVTERGQKHLEELIRLKNEGHSTEILFFIQRSDVEEFSPADEIDPEYGRLLRKAQDSGVQITPLAFKVDHNGIEYVKALPIRF